MYHWLHFVMICFKSNYFFYIIGADHRVENVVNSEHRTYRTSTQELSNEEELMEIDDFSVDSSAIQNSFGIESLDSGSVDTKFTIDGIVCSVKKNIHFRVTGFPFHEPAKKNRQSKSYPRTEDKTKFVCIRGTVILVNPTMVLNYKQLFICTKCKVQVEVDADYDQFYKISAPTYCKEMTDKGECSSTKFIAVKDSKKHMFDNNKRDYQEITVQQPFGESLGASGLTKIQVTLEDDLADSCNTGDDIFLW